ALRVACLGREPDGFRNRFTNGDGLFQPPVLFSPLGLPDILPPELLGTVPAVSARLESIFLLKRCPNRLEPPGRVSRVLQQLAQSQCLRAWQRLIQNGNRRQAVDVSAVGAVEEAVLRCERLQF